MRVRWRTVVTISFVVVLLLPLVRTGDGVPLSSYPMYSSPRSPETTFIVAVGQQFNGERVELSPFTVAGTADPLIVETYLRREVRNGRVEQLCSLIAGRIGGDDIADDDVAAIEIRSERYDVVDRILDQRPPVSTEVLALCPVP